MSVERSPILRYGRLELVIESVPVGYIRVWWNEYTPLREGGVRKGYESSSLSTRTLGLSIKVMQHAVNVQKIDRYNQSQQVENFNIFVGWKIDLIGLIGELIYWKI